MADYIGYNFYKNSRVRSESNIANNIARYLIVASYNGISIV